MTMRIGILGGTFNPVHYGHLLLAESAREQLALDRVLFIPVRQPPHKSSKGLISGVIRLRLIERAIHDNPAFVVSDVELGRQSVSYTLETVKILQKRMLQAKLFLIMGKDMLSVRWHGWQELKTLCTVAVAHREGAKTLRRETKLTSLKMPQVDMSSTEIRRRVRLGLSIRYMVPPAVERIITEDRLYQKGSA